MEKCHRKVARVIRKIQSCSGKNKGSQLVGTNIMRAEEGSLQILQGK